MIEISYIISNVFSTIHFIILAYLISTFLPLMGVNTDNVIFRFLNDVGSVFLAPGRMIFDALGISTGTIDFSPILSIMLLRMLESVLIAVFR